MSASVLTKSTAAASTVPAAVEPDGACCAPVPHALDEAQAARSASVLKALADPNRLRMLALIAAQPADEPLCACDVEASFELSQPTVSHHLKVLREAGLISVSKQGVWHYYALRPDGLEPVHAALALLASPVLK